MPKPLSMSLSMSGLCSLQSHFVLAIDDRNALLLNLREFELGFILQLEIACTELTIFNCVFRQEKTEATVNTQGNSVVAINDCNATLSHLRKTESESELQSLIAWMELSCFDCISILRNCRRITQFTNQFSSCNLQLQCELISFWGIRIWKWIATCDCMNGVQLIPIWEIGDSVPWDEIEIHSCHH